MARVAVEKKISDRKPDADVIALHEPKAVLRYSDLSPEKLRGGYYTPPEIAAWLVAWAVRTPQDTILEPSCGDGSILSAGISRLISLGATKQSISKSARGIELIAPEAEAARKRISSVLGKYSGSVVEVADFFSWYSNNERRFSTAVGNPPFIRYQSFPEPSRSRAMKLMEDFGLRPNKLTNIWVPFVVAAAESLQAGGRLALVIPAELLQVTYAAQLRAYLTDRFAHVGIIACNELMFAGVEQEVLLLLAEGALPQRVKGNTCRVAVVQIEHLSDLLLSDPAHLLASAEEKDVRGDEEKWLKYFLTASEVKFMREMRNHPKIAQLSRFADVDVGVVTGKNEFFIVRDSQIEANGLHDFVGPIVSRSAHLKGAIFSSNDWKTLSKADERVHLLNIEQTNPKRLPAAVFRYIQEGEKQGFDKGYKCSIRTPWYKVPTRWTPDGFLFRQIHDFPRFVLNSTKATSTDTIHRFMAIGCDPKSLIASTFTHLTAASAEIEGRSYGGGVLELEPTEAGKLLVPAIQKDAVPLEEADELIRKGKLSVLLKENDKRILRGTLGLSTRDCLALQNVWQKLRDRRLNRNKKRVKIV